MESGLVSGTSWPTLEEHDQDTARSFSALSHCDVTSRFI